MESGCAFVTASAEIGCNFSAVDVGVGRVEGDSPLSGGELEAGEGYHEVVGFWEVDGVEELGVCESFVCADCFVGLSLEREGKDCFKGVGFAELRVLGVFVVEDKAPVFDSGLEEGSRSEGFVPEGRVSWESVVVEAKAVLEGECRGVRVIPNVIFCEELDSGRDGSVWINPNPG